ncbi:MAG: peptidylprolyl isomerase [Acidobacteria bacterium]|nr:peptidylprolyl isomerase [Acidobacteriota bacterium]
MNWRVRQIAVIGCLAFAAASSSALGQTASQCLPPAESAFRSMSRAEMEAVIADVAETNPALIERLRDEPELRKAQVENIRELLAFASAAVKDGLAAESVNCAELANIRDELVAGHFSLGAGEAKTLFRDTVSEEQVAAYWKGSSAQESAERKASFERFIAVKLALLARDSADGEEPSVTQEERKQAEDFFARTKIAVSEFESRKTQVSDRTKGLIEINIKLQQAQFLARRYSETIGSKTSATDDEIAKFIAARPEFDNSAKKAKAEQILVRAKKGEDFAVLANEFSQDPGNRDESGKLAGGLYKGVGRGVFLPAFEQAALSLKPGEIFPTLVETDFGFHVVKLERKDSSADGTFDVRHILIDTTVADPKAPEGRGLPVGEYARQQIETEKERKLLALLIQTHQITVADDFVLPAAAEKPQPRDRN